MPYLCFAPAKSSPGWVPAGAKSLVASGWHPPQAGISRDAQKLAWTLRGDEPSNQKKCVSQSTFWCSKWSMASTTLEPKKKLIACWKELRNAYKITRLLEWLNRVRLQDRPIDWIVNAKWSAWVTKLHWCHVVLITSEKTLKPSLSIFEFCFPK